MVTSKFFLVEKKIEFYPCTGKPAFSPFPTMFTTPSKMNFEMRLSHQATRVKI